MRLFTFLLKALCIYCIVCGAASCTRSDYHEPAYSRADVPKLSVGNWWRYRVYDSIARHTDTLTLRVASADVSATGIFAKCYIVDTGAVVDSAFIILSDTGMIYQGYIPTSSRLGNYFIRLPFHAGDSWSYYFDGDRFVSLPYLPLVTASGHDYYVFDISRYTVIPDNTTEQHLQIARGVGLVAEGYSFSGFTGRTQWFGVQLIDYSLN